jgi:hypothetical protein
VRDVIAKKRIDWWEMIRNWSLKDPTRPRNDDDYEEVIYPGAWKRRGCDDRGGYTEMKSRLVPQVRQVYQNMNIWPLRLQDKS